MQLSTDQARTARYLSPAVRAAAAHHGFNLDDNITFDSLVDRSAGFTILTQLTIGTQGALIFDSTHLIAVSIADLSTDVSEHMVSIEPVRFGRTPAEVSTEIEALFGDGPTLGTLEDYVRISAEDSNLAWRIDVGHITNLLDIAIERLGEDSPR